MAFETEKLVLANGALLRLGAKKIDALTEDSDRAVLCAQWVDPIRKETLRAHPWNFAIVRDTLNSFPQATLTPGATSGNGVPFTTSVGVFTENDLRYKIAGNQGVAIIRTFVNAAEVRADIVTNFPNTSPIAAEAWQITPNHKWSNRYSKPTGYLRVVEVVGIGTAPGNPPFSWTWMPGGNEPEPVAVEGQFLVTDVGPKMNIAYIEDVENPTLWDENCRNAYEALLAFRICYGVTGSLAASKTQWDAFQASLREARTADGQEDTPHDVGSDILIAVRK